MEEPLDYELLVYRVTITPYCVQIKSYDPFDDDNDVSGIYNRLDDLPMWVQERIAVLKMIPTTPPIPHVRGVGRRITETVFWLEGERNDG